MMLFDFLFLLFSLLLALSSLEYLFLFGLVLYLYFLTGSFQFVMLIVFLLSLFQTLSMMLFHLFNCFDSLSLQLITFLALLSYLVYHSACHFLFDHLFLFLLLILYLLSCPC